MKNVGEGPADAIIEAREAKGLPKDIFQFIDDLDIHRINKKAVESLIKAGALDCFSENRAAHMGIFESLIESAQSNAKNVLEGQLSLFQLNAETMEESQDVKRLPDVKNFEKDVLIAQEKEMLGVYITDHPLTEYRDMIERSVTVTSQDLAEVLESEESGETHSFITDGMSAVMAGIVTGRKTLITKNSKMMAFVDMEDLYGTVEVVVFPNVYERYGALTTEDSIISVAGTINFKEGEVPKLLADRITDIRALGELAADEGADGSGAGGSWKGAGSGQNGSRHSSGQAATVDATSAGDVPEGLVKIKLPAGDTSEMLNRIKDIMTAHRGGYQAIVYMPTGGSFRTERDLWVDPDMDFRRAVIDIVGEENYKG